MHNKWIDGVTFKIYPEKKKLCHVVPIDSFENFNF